MGFFAKIWLKIKGIFAVIWNDVEPLLDDLASEAGKMALKYAQLAVTAMLQQGLSGTAAREQAFELIADAMKKEGLALGTDYAARIINQAIEAMVAKLVPKK